MSVCRDLIKLFIYSQQINLYPFPHVTFRRQRVFLTEFIFRLKKNKQYNIIVFRAILFNLIVVFIGVAYYYPRKVFVPSFKINFIITFPCLTLKCELSTHKNIYLEKNVRRFSFDYLFFSTASLLSIYFSFSEFRFC